ncbi:AfsR/SARP family transcriptional regulator [Streptomyces sp. SS]|uniref:AfsR/SARP family transcriptional regulator n=1 Tax=Streptomyces sp. SS TaxID=260742 RepID=UPI0003106F9D|nr:tetratricopeptide repeat protein [Streptomyces sp. SS]
MDVRFALLGPLSATDEGGEERAPRPPLPRALLAALLLAPNRVVTLDRLAGMLWDGRPPASARASLHNHVTRLRRSLGDPTRILSRDRGLVLRVEDGELDADRLVGALDEARRARHAEDWEHVSRVTEAALALWRGAPLEEFPALAAGAASDLTRWQETRLQCLELRAEAVVRLGSHEEFLPELRRAAAEFPLRESFHTHLILMLHHTGRRAEALETYHELRRSLVDALGVEPGPGARAAFQQVLDDDGAPVEQPGRPVTGSAAVPRALPRDPVAFTGREAQISALLTDLRAGAEGGPGPVDLHTVDGMPGVGKTAFALRVAHHVGADYPDGQIFLPLHAHTVGTPPVAPEDALAELLLAVGESPHRVPDGLAARAGLWRSRVAGRRMVILLDDASGSDQVEPLLPGTAGSLVLVTSRRRLEALTGATPITLGVLPEDDAIRLLITRSGRPDITPDDPALARLAHLCGHLPLALNLVSARLRHRRSWSPADIAEDLGTAAGRLAALASENVSVAAAFDLSYRALSSPSRTLLCRLGLLPGCDVDVRAAAALHGSDPGTARRLLEELCDHSLVDEPSRGRYQMHDLVREYARTLALADGPADADPAVRRLLDHYLHAASDAGIRIARHAVHPPELTAERPATLPEFADAGEATAWMRAEHANLRAAVEHASRHGLHEAAVYLPAAMHDFLRVDGHWGEAQDLHRIALAAAGAAGDELGQALSLHHLAIVDSLKGSYEQAESGLLQALLLVRSRGDRRREGMMMHDLGRVFRFTGRYEEATDALEQSLECFAGTGDRRDEGLVRNELGHVLQLAGRYPEAAESVGLALASFRDTGDRLGLANSLATLADILRSLGRYAESMTHHRQALSLYGELGNVLGEANVLADLGDVLRLTGAYEEAKAHLTESVRKHDQIGSRLGVANSLTYLARVHFRCGEIEEAEHCLRRSLAICEQVNSAMGRAYTKLHLAEAAHLRGAHDQARDEAERCLAAFRDLGDLGGEVAALHVHGSALLAAGLPEQAAARHRESLVLAGTIQALYEELLAHQGIADCLVALGRHALAVPHLRTALDIAERLRVPETDALRRRLATDPTPADTTTRTPAGR